MLQRRWIFHVYTAQSRIILFDHLFRRIRRRNSSHNISILVVRAFQPEPAHTHGMITLHRSSRSLLYSIVYFTIHSESERWWYDDGDRCNSFMCAHALPPHGMHFKFIPSDCLQCHELNDICQFLTKCANFVHFINNETDGSPFCVSPAQQACNDDKSSSSSSRV